MSSPINITVIEDNKSYREVIHLALKRDEELNIKSEFGTAEIALRELNSAMKKPDVILLDLNLPGISGIQAIPYLQEVCPESKIIILSQSNAEQDVVKCITRGVAGYLLKSSGIKEIRQAVKDVYNGGGVFEPTIATYLVNLVKSKEGENTGEKLLTDRELGVLKLLGDGLLKKEISGKLCISYSTVDTHVRHIYEKLDARNAPSAINIAHRLGLID